ncbi:unnamed protein product [Adineta steineri]|uniref:Uncharacterized protein n=1 Tax=Adineta steineri TaxID=433720 RepID=A0A814BR54_9BILA|nr:unnamed protein product [Adineta steineri]CAF1089495.1 unnamed protein product [Adineta steineri]CAF1099401.1 unnamed protein product [Adineta steineri]
MNAARAYYAASTLSNGSILVAGGSNGSSNYLNSAELHNPITGTWTTTENMNVAREFHTASTLADGKVLVMGGDNGPVLNSAELY